MTPSEALGHIDRYGETPLFDCPRCGDECAKACLPLDLWHCTACGSSGKASRLVAPRALKPTVEHLV